MKRYAAWIAVSALFLIAGGALLLRSISGSWTQAMSPGYWASRWAGRPDYDPATRVLRQGNPKLREIALTIDDGPHSGTGDRILDILKREHVRATFFVVGVRMKQRPDLVRRMFAEGHEVGNHTLDHLRLDALTPEQARHEINDNDINLCRLAGRHFRLLRPPGVRYNGTVLRVARDLDYQIVSWGVAAKDFLEVPPDYIVDRVLKGTFNGSVILLHDDYPETVAALPRILSALKRQGYRFVTISEMLAHLPTPVIVPPSLAADPLQPATAHPIVVARAKPRMSVGNSGKRAARNP